MSLVDIFGNIVNKNLTDHPVFTRNFVKLGYGAQQLMLKFGQDSSLLPSQKYLGEICMRYTRKPMHNPQKSALVNLFMPCEILHAMDIYPMCVEGFAAFLSGGKSERVCLENAEGRGVSDTYCSFHRALLGAVYSDMIKKPGFIITTNTVCDSNYSTFNAIAGHFKSPKFFIDVPGEESEAALDYVKDQLVRMIKFLEDTSGKKLNPEKLTEAIANSNRAVDANERFINELSVKQMPTNATLEMYRLLTNHILLGTEEAAKFYEMLAEDVQRCGTGGKKRILWCHVLPFGMKVMSSWFSDDGPYQLLPTDLHYDSMMCLNPDDPIQSMAERLIRNHFNGNVTNRIESVLGMAEKLNADGAVLFCHWGCKASNGSIFMVKDALKDKGIPSIVIDGDACDSRNMSEGQFTTRMQAFFEVLEGIS